MEFLQKKPTYLTNNFLIAMPNVHGDDFSKTVTYLCQHDKEGALGIVVNKPHEMVMGDIFLQLNITPVDKSLSQHVIYSGGPVQPERGFVLHPITALAEKEWDATITVNDNVSLTSSKDIIEAIAQGKGPDKWLMALGYAGWGSGQLEQEINRNAWLHNEAEQELIFDVPSEQCWQKAAEKLKVDLNLMTNTAGHC